MEAAGRGAELQPAEISLVCYYSKIILILFGSNIKLNDRKLFTYFQYIKDPLLSFIDKGKIEMDAIIKRRKVQFLLKLI